MRDFNATAASLFESAENAFHAGLNPSDITLVIDRDGSCRLIADCDWSLDALAEHLGGAMVFRISQSAGRLRLEGRCGTRRCLLQTERPPCAQPPLASLLRPLLPHLPFPSLPSAPAA